MRVNFFRDVSPTYNIWVTCMAGATTTMLNRWFFCLLRVRVCMKEILLLLVRTITLYYQHSPNPAIQWKIKGYHISVIKTLLTNLAFRPTKTPCPHFVDVGNYWSRHRHRRFVLVTQCAMKTRTNTPLIGMVLISKIFIMRTFEKDMGFWYSQAEGRAETKL